MSNDLRILEKHRDALLLAEVAAWLHMFGKLQIDFLNGKFHLARDIPKLVREEFPQLDVLLKGSWVGAIWQTLPLGGSGTEGLSIRHLIRAHEDQNLSKFSEVLRKLLIDSHGRGSGIEKGMLDKFSFPHNNPVYLSTAVGYEVSLNRVDIELSQLKLYKFLQGSLKCFHDKNAQFSGEEWLRIQKTFVKRMYQYFQTTLAETRRPLNDVTLLDQTAMTVAFFKAALAQNLLSGKTNIAIHDNTAYRYRWCLLHVGLNGLEFWGSAMRIGDLLARKALVEVALNQVQSLLEVRYPLGSEVYRDENGSVFIVPDVPELKTYTNGSQSLEGLIQTIAKDKDTFSGEAQFTITLSDSTRDTLLFGKVATEQLPKPVPNISWIQEQWQGVKSDICPVCGCRPQGPSCKASRRKVCDVCEERRTDRSMQWIKKLEKLRMIMRKDNGGNPDTTIWIDEVADQHGHLAFVAARFEMSDWLNGSAFNSILSFDPQSHTINNNANINFDLQVLVNNIQEGLQSGQVFDNNSLLGQLVSDENTRGRSNSVKDFYNLRIQGTDLEPISNLSQPERLTLSLLRQQPSFARIRRTWETTRTFWQEIVSKFSCKDSVGEVETRIALRGKFTPNTDNTSLGIAHSYELKLGTLRLSVIYTPKEEFLVAENLQYIAALLDPSDGSGGEYAHATERIQRFLSQAKSVDIEEPTGYGNPNKLLGKLQITDVTLEATPYLPAITILTEPQTFMALIPADKALQVAEQIKDKYEREMGKVQNRLPLTLGIVFADRRMPLPAILDAGRRMLQQPTHDECWTIKEIKPTPSASDNKLILKKVELTLEKDAHLLKVEIPTVMGDDTTEDAWYPYWCVESDQNGNTPTNRRRQFTSIHGKQWVHACDLLAGDHMYWSPSRFDFELLDTAARRFEVSYTENGERRGTLRPARPYYLAQLGDLKQVWDILYQHLSTSQLDNLIGLIETKRQEWLIQQDDSVFQKAVKDILYNANWQGGSLSSQDFRCLIHAAVSGQLADVAELFVTIQKKKTMVDSIGETK